MRTENAIARLMRAGDRNSRMWKKIEESIDDLAAWLGSVLPGGAYPNALPRNYTFQHFTSGEYEFFKPSLLGHSQVVLNKANKSRDDIARFCEEIETGFLNELEQMLEKQSDELEKAAGKILEFVLKPTDPPAA